jgi:endo-1,4-beta-xylanase
VDGVGIQGHWIIDQVPFEDIEESIEVYANLGLEVMFTELDLDVIERPDCSADLDVQRAYALPEDVYRKGCPAWLLQRQAEQYQRLFRLFARHPAVTRATFWGLHDGKSWLNSWPGKRTNHPLLFDRLGTPKPAFWSVLEAARR